MKTPLLLTALLVAGSVAMFAADEPKDQPAKAAWKITGDLEEACSCDVPCPCWFAAKPTQMGCDGVQVIFIKTGTYGDTKLDGLAIASLVQSPEGQTMMDSFGNWNFSYLYLDEKATPEQRTALHEIAMQILPVAGAKKVVERTIPIDRKLDGEHHEITLGQYGGFSGHLMEGGLGGAPKIMNPPGADPVHQEYNQGLSTKLTYNDAGQKWDYSKTNYMQASFTVDSQQYEKYAAGLAKKMKEMKPEKTDDNEKK
jgi:hypothetical protein